jgi:uncharacterized protein YaaQ
MKLVIAIIHSQDSRALVDALMQGSHRATLVSTTGGFLREGNATVFIGTQEENLQEILDIIRQNCHTRSQFVNPLPPVMEPGEMYLPNPVEVEVGGATVFVLDVAQFERY